MVDKRMEGGDILQTTALIAYIIKNVKRDQLRETVRISCS